MAEGSDHLGQDANGLIDGGDQASGVTNGRELAELVVHLHRAAFLWRKFVAELLFLQPQSAVGLGADQNPDRATAVELLLGAIWAQGDDLVARALKAHRPVVDPADAQVREIACLKAVVRSNEPICTPYLVPTKLLKKLKM